MRSGNGRGDGVSMWTYHDDIRAGARDPPPPKTLRLSGGSKRLGPAAGEARVQSRRRDLLEVGPRRRFADEASKLDWLRRHREGIGQQSDEAAGAARVQKEQPVVARGGVKEYREGAPDPADLKVTHVRANRGGGGGGARVGAESAALVCLPLVVEVHEPRDRTARGDSPPAGETAKALGRLRHRGGNDTGRGRPLPHTPRPTPC
eukprot:scaffold1619_cov121-Isochrysis_galbana.AAC.7